MTTTYDRSSAAAQGRTASSQSAAQGRASSSQSAALSLPVPAEGQTLSLDMTPGSALRFAFDPGQATLGREGNDLTFSLDNGGSVTVTDFFVVEEGGQLPALILPDGEEVAAELAFADSGLDLSTAAGPASASPQGSGGSYSDDPGSLTNGIDRLGDQGTHYWGYSREVTEEARGLEFPGGRFSLDGVSDLGGLIGVVGAVYEDGLPYQHEGDRDSFVPGQLQFTFMPEGSTVVDGIHLSGFPAGTVLYFGDPNDPDTPRVTVGGPDEVFDFTEQDFADGVYFVPPKNSDDDFELKVSVDVRSENSGLTDTIHGTTTVVVDAVADKPELGDDLSAVGDSSGHVSDKTSSEQKYEDGYNKTESTVSTSENGGGATVTVTVQAVFDDYLDGSEKHYLLIQTHDSLALDPDSLPPGYSYAGTIVVDGVEYHQIEVDNSVVEAGNGSVTLPVDFTTTGQADEKDGKDETFELKVGAYAQEDVDPSGEIDLDNNKAHIVTEDGDNVTASVDVVNSTLNVTAGWASEGNNASKHVGGSGSGYAGVDYDGMDEGQGVDELSTNANGAPISIGLDQSGREGSAEFITSVELTFDEGRGELTINGQPVYDGMPITGPSGATYLVGVDPDTGKVTITVTGGQVDNLDELNMAFRPDQTGDHRYDSTDVGMDYTVNVSNGAGAKGVYEGTTEIVIDAVADKPVGVGGAGVDYGQGQSAALPGQTVEISVKATFPDTGGSEKHTVFVRVDGNNGSATHGYGGQVISDERISQVNGLAGSNVLNPNGDYLELVIPPLEAFGPDNTYTYPDLGITIKYEGNGKYTVSGIEVTLPDEETLTDGNKGNGELNPDTGDTNMNFDTVAWAEEPGGAKGSSAADNEHDTGNNNAFTKGSVTVGISTAGGGGKFTLGAGQAFENDQPHNNIPADGSDPQGSANNSQTDGGTDLSITWDLADSKEYVSEVYIDIPLDRYGNPVGEIYYKGQPLTPDANGRVSIPVDQQDGKTGFDEGDLSFVPKGHDSGKVELEVSVKVEDPSTGDSQVKEVGNIDVDVDAVANRSGEVAGSAVYGDGLSAVATGDPVVLNVTTSFADNDGSERHFVLVQQQPHWQGEYDVEYYDLDGDGVSEPYFKVPVPGAPPQGAADDYPGDEHHLSADDWARLCETGTVTTAGGVTITIPKGADGKFDPSGEWQVEARVELDPPALSEGSHFLGTGSLVEEHDINHSTENRGDDYKDNNIAMRPGNDLTVEVNNTGGIKVTGDFLYEAGQQMPGGDIQNGVIHVAPSSGDDSFYGDLTVSIPSGHGDFYLNGEKLEPGQDYDVTVKDKDGNDVSGKLTVTDEGGRLSATFTPDNPDDDYKGLDLEVGLKDNDYSDRDIKVDVEGNLQNDKSGQQTPGVGGKGEVMVDAVAQKPDDVQGAAEDHAPVAPGSADSVTVSLSAVFEDSADNSESHFFLLEAKPGHAYTFTVNGETHTIDVTSEWPTVLGPDGKLYYKIPASPGADGKASLDVEVGVTRPWLGGDKSDIKYGAMSEDKPTDSGEKTYDNNIAFDVDGSVTVDVGTGQGGDDPIRVDVAYENNTPDANTGDTGTQYAKIDMPADAEAIRLNPGQGSIMIKEGDSYRKLEPDENGWVTVPKGAEGDIYFAAPDNCSDKDLPLGYEITGGRHDGQSGTETVYVDAVAQPATVDGAAVATGAAPGGGDYSHVGDGPVTVTVSLSGLVDGDPETSYYVLIEAKPGWECLEEGAELVLVDGKAYFRVPVDPSLIEDGKAEVPVKMQTPPAGANGEVNDTLAVGSMVVDRPSDSGESRMDNNVAVNVDGKVEINKSVAEPNLKLDLGETYEHKLGDAAGISVSGVGSHDEVTQITFSVDPGQGVFTYDGQVIGAAGYSDEHITITFREEGGKTIITVTATPPATGLSEQELRDYVNGKLGVQTADGNTSNADIPIEWGYEVRDTQSGDTAGKSDQPGTVVVDAVAHQPKVTDYDVDYGQGREAAEPGETVTVKAVVEFTKIGDETNYVLVHFTPGWEVNGITLTVNGVQIHFTADEIRAMDLFYPDGTGKGAYYKVPLEKDGVSLDPGVGEGGAYSVDVEVETKVPDKGVSGDGEGRLGIGGAAVDSYGDGETDLSNNVASDVKNGDADGNGINIGVVDSTGLEAGQKGDAPEEGQGNVIGVNIAPVGGENDVITGLTLTTSDQDAGDFWYDGQKLAYGPGGTVLLPPAGAGDDWVFDSSKLEFRPGENYGGQVNVKVEGTVSDAKSGATKDGFETDMNIEVTPVATQPTGLEATSGFDQQGGLWTLTLTAHFADADGSEEHFFLFRIPDGLSLDGEYPGLEPALGPNGESGYWKIPVDSENPDPSLDLHFKADAGYDGSSGVEYHAGASENGETAWADAPLGGNTASPADDGGFDFRTEEASGHADFSQAGENLFISGSGLDDTIIGGRGDDTIMGGNGNDVIYATQGDNLLAGGAGNDTLYGGDGRDTFFWDVSHFGQDQTAHDVLWNFEYGKDALAFNDVFGDDMDLSSVDSILGFLDQGKGAFADNSLSLNGESGSLTAEFTDNGVLLNIASGDASQTIEVNFGGQGAVYEPPSSADEAAELLRNLISQGIL